ncbi:hypothetical protein DP939_35270 [Spongiactinospora rosea]|uniref:Uncharacterized protein n=1 Tax=Spongiactinospora rosea TaxID=2248750 RepID=A0A366LNZ6_9ACTN|nr:hypothetical protein [Spongiactinospora rosea]RBQ15370.1 hypothetical protein DP939_35270 [Spongiactinospora rosea]
MTRIPRLDTARRIFTYAADTIGAFFGMLVGLQKLATLVLTSGDHLDAALRWRSAAAGICLIAVYVCFWRMNRTVFRENAPARPPTSSSAGCSPRRPLA